VTGLQKEDRGQLLMACGTGKTLTSLWIKEEMGAGRTLILFPSLNLLSQSLKEWTQASKKEMRWICVCSDSTVAKQNKNPDEWVVNLSDLGISVTTEAQDIRSFLDEYSDGVVFSTYHSSPLIEIAQREADSPFFDLVIADEAHRCAGKVSTAYGCVLDEKRILARKRLFMTATPRILSAKTKKKAGDDNIEVACMDDVSRFGVVLYQLSFSEAIDRDLLSDYKIVIVGVDNPTIQAKISQKSLVKTSTGLVDSETLANHIALSKAIRDYSLKRLITFHGRIQKACDFSVSVVPIMNCLPPDSRPSRKIKAGFVHGEMETNRRSAQIQGLRDVAKDEVGILSNARCLSEGVDVPSLDGVVFIDPRRSVVDIVQAVGRAIRKADDKTCGYIILPVYLGDAEELEEEVFSSKFSEIWKILLALKSQDDSLSSVLDQIRVDKKTRSNAHKTHSIFGSKIIIDTPRHVSEAFSDSLRTLLIENTTDNWLDRYGELILYLEENENKYPTQDHILGRWVDVQRTNYKRGMLLKRRIELLDEISFLWSPHESKWQLRYHQAVSFFECNGHLNVARTYPLLGPWVREQRSQYSKGNISQERIELLERIGMIWNLIDSHWWEGFNLLKEFVDKNGHADAPVTKVNRLGVWVQVQRREYKKGNLTQDKIDALEQLGFTWSIRDSPDENFAKKYGEVMKYAQNSPDLLRIRTEDKSLYTWINNQRSLYKKNKMPQNRIEMLESVPGWKWSR